MASKTKIEIVGVIESVEKVQAFASGFKKQVVNIKDGFGEEKYPTYFPVTFKKDLIAQLDGWKAGDRVFVVAFAGGSKWVKKDANGKPVQPPRFFAEYDGYSIAAPEAGVSGGEAEAAPEDDGEPIQDDMPF